MKKKIMLISLLLILLMAVAACSSETVGENMPEGWELFTSPAMETEFCVPLEDIESGEVPAYGDSQYALFCFDGCGKGMDGLRRARAESGIVTAYLMNSDGTAMSPCQYFVMVDILEETWGAEVPASTEMIFGKLYKICTLRQDDLRQTVILVEREDTLYQITASAPASDFSEVYDYAKCIADTIHPSPIDWSQVEGYEGSEKQQQDLAEQAEQEGNENAVTFGD